MTRGSILFLGKENREADLLMARLAREGFQVFACATEKQLREGVNRGDVQAMLVSVQTTKPVADRAIAIVRAHRRTKHIPIILVTDAEVPQPLTTLKGVGEVFRLHTIPLARAVRRLNLAIQLTQLAN